MIGDAGNNDRKWWVLVGTALAGLMVSLDFSVVNLALTAIQKDFSSALNQLQWIMTGFGIAFCAFLVAMGRLADIKGHRRLLYLGIVGFGLCSLGAGFSSSVTELIVFRVLQGVTGATLFPCGMSLTAAAFPKSQQGRALGIYNGILGVGLALAPLVGGYIVSFLGWRWVFFVNIPVVVVSLSICLWAIRGKDEKKPHRVDGFGIALLAFTLSCIVFSVSQGPDHGWTSPTILITFGLGVLSALVFVIVETRMSEPLIPFALLRNRSFLTAAILSVVAVGFAWAVVFLAPLYLHQVFGYSSYQVGLLLLPMTVMTAIIPPLAGRLLDSRGALACVLLILVLTVGSYSLQLMSHQLFVVLLAFALFGAAWGAGNGIGVPLALMEVDDLADSGVMSGAVITLLNVSGVLVLSLSATVLHSFQTSALRQHLSPPSALAHGYQVTVAVLLLLTLVLMAIAIGSARSRSTPRERKTG